MLLDFRKPNIYICEKVLSWSGRYLCFLGNHWDGNENCWVVGASDKVTGQITQRHYSTRNGALAPKAEAETFWREFKLGMLKKPVTEVTDDTIQWPWEKDKRHRN